MVDGSANAGVANKIVARLIGAADFAARHDSAPIEFPQPDMIVINRTLGIVAGCDEVAKIQSASLSVSPVRIRNA
jgi:hypothetical protein